jgi:Pilin accessory protein (PilO)
MQVDFISARAFTLNGVTFVAGLTWFTESGLGRKESQTKAIDEGRAIGEECYAIRLIDKKHYQFGTVAQSDATRKSVVFSIAAHVAAGGQLKRLPTTWVGLFQLTSDKFLYISIRDGALMPDGDRVVTRDIGLTLLQEARDIGTEAIVAANELGFDSPAFALDLLGILSPVGKGGKNEFRVFRPGEKAARSFKRFVLPLVFIALVAAMATALYWWQAQEAKLEAERRALAAQQAALKNKVTIIVPKPAWEDRPAARNVIEACHRALLARESTPAGWSWRDTVCDEKQVTHAYTRPNIGGGTIGQFRNAVDEEVTFSDAGDAASVVSVFTTLANAAQEVPPQAEESKRIFIASAQSHFLTFSLGKVETPVMPPPKPGEAYEKASWQQRLFSYEGNSVDASALLAPAATPIMRITKITHSSGNRTKIEGQLYAK